VYTAVYPASLTPTDIFSNLMYLKEFMLFCHAVTGYPVVQKPADGQLFAPVQEHVPPRLVGKVTHEQTG
jgi:hypothetical protein